jgi:hypothetical protein
MDVKEIAMLAGGVLAVIGLLISFYYLADVQCMSDKDRADIGFGPKGQGK